MYKQRLVEVYKQKEKQLVYYKLRPLNFLDLE